MPSRRPSAPLLFLLLLGCARMEPPPGGPPDFDPPRLIATVPDSLASLPEFRGEVEFQFDEVVSEGGSASQGTGTGDLERLVILSPTNRVPAVEWRRSRITVRPDEGWQRDRVYRVELLPGVTDLRRNRSQEGAVVTFTTGAPVPRARLAGLVIDWTSSRPAANALVVATLLPDSLPYRGIADSAGRFTLGPLPDGEYLVSGVVDQNRNLRADGREAFDTARVRVAGDEPVAVGELWAFVRDTTPPRISGIRLGDSVAAVIEVSQPLAPGLQLRPTDATVALLPDSTPVPVASILPKPLDDSLNAPPSPPADTAAAAADTATRRPPVRPGARRPGVPRTEVLTSRPPLSNQLVVRVARRWSPGARYVITVRGLRTVSGATGEGRGTLVVPERPAAADSLPSAPDTAAPPPE